MTSFDELNSTLSTKKFSTSSKIPDATPFFNIYSTITFTIIGIVLIFAMISVVLIYKIRLNYLIKRQINQLKRIDQQMGIERDFTY